jgi:uncharacterized protein (TIGR00251 family)
MALLGKLLESKEASSLSIGLEADKIEMEDLRGAIEPHPRGLIIRFEVSPGSGELAVPSGFNPWRRTLEARLTEEPTKGKANRQLTDEVARILGIPKSDVEVLRGHKSNRKVLLITGVEIEQAIFCLKKKC